MNLELMRRGSNRQGVKFPTPLWPLYFSGIALVPLETPITEQKRLKKKLWGYTGEWKSVTWTVRETHPVTRRGMTLMAKLQALWVLPMRRWYSILEEIRWCYRPDRGTRGSSELMTLACFPWILLQRFLFLEMRQTMIHVMDWYQE